MNFEIELRAVEKTGYAFAVHYLDLDYEVLGILPNRERASISSIDRKSYRDWLVDASQSAI